MRKICFPIMNRIHYARQKLLLDLFKRDKRFDLHVVGGGSVFFNRYGEPFAAAMQKAGFKVADALYHVIEGGNHVAMAKTAGLASMEFANVLHKLEPDIVLIRGDRFEQLAMAMSAAYLNKTIAHIEGGDVSGTIDESVRHAITKLSHVHFVTNEDSKKRVIRMGEDPRTVFNVGSTDVEFAVGSRKKLDGNFLNSIGTGSFLNFKKPYIVVMYHPVTTENTNRRATETLLKVVDGLNTQAVWFWPNNDAGSAEISKAIRVYREIGVLKNNKIRFLTNLEPDDFMALLKNSTALVGNSSAGIKESSYLGVPVVNIGTRQAGRLRGQNVLDAGYEADIIKKTIKKQIAHGRYEPSRIYHKQGTSQKIVDILSKIKLTAQKRFYE